MLRWVKGAGVSGRCDWIDRVRGLAIVLMILDHGLLVAEPAHPLRSTLTRLSLPLFMLASAAVWRPSLRRMRLLWLFLASAVEVAAAAILEMPVPGIVTVYLVAVVPLSHWYKASEHAWALGCVGLLQALYLPVGWTGYEPGLVLAWWALGRLGSWQLEAAGRRLPALLSPIGRHPLGWYIGHLVALVLVVEAVG